MNLILKPILNRDFQHPGDGWYHIEAKGEHPNAASGVTQVIDARSINAIVEQFNADAAQPDYPGMLIDVEHFKHDLEKESRAYGWLMKLQARADGIYGQIRWTGIGQKAVDGGEYRFFSTEYEAADFEPVTGAKNRVRPLRLDGLTLTNANNNKGQRPITNRAVSKEDSIAQIRQWASEEFETEVARLVNTYRLPESEAKEFAAFTQSDIATSAGFITNREPMEQPSAKRICDQFCLLVNRHRTNRQLSFADAWQQVAIMERNLFLACVRSE